MTEPWMDEVLVWIVKKHLESKKFADRVQMIQKLLKLMIESLDGMEAEVAAKCP